MVSSRRERRARRRPLPRVAWLVLALTACEPGRAHFADVEAEWTIDRNPSAFLTWDALPRDEADGATAHERLDDADRLYRRGLRELEVGDTHARPTFEEAIALAPMRPIHYLTLARIYRERAASGDANAHLYVRAAESYRRFIALAPADSQIDAARTELEEIDPASSEMFGHEPPRESSAPSALDPWLVALALAVASLGGALLGKSWRTRLTLDQLVRDKPELHPALAYAISTLRHEVLKHRLGAFLSAEPLPASASEQHRFVTTRLLEREPLSRVLARHQASFSRALGPELDLEADPIYARFAGSVRAVERASGEVVAGTEHGRALLLRLGEAVRALEASFKIRLTKLVRTSIDRAFLDEIVHDVTHEYAASHVELATIDVVVPTDAPAVDAFRVDLALVLRNLVRNAVLAVGEEPDAERHLRIEVAVELLASGEETVTISVLDSAKTSLSNDDLDAGLDHGLGLVKIALARYDAALRVRAVAAPFTKAVELRFFRAYDPD